MRCFPSKSKGQPNQKHPQRGVFDILFYFPFFPPFLAFFAASMTRFASSRFFVLWGCDFFLLVSPVRLFAIQLLSALINNAQRIAEKNKKENAPFVFYQLPTRQPARNANNAWRLWESRSNTPDIFWSSDRRALLCVNAR